MTKFLNMENLVKRLEKERPDILKSMENTEIEYNLLRQKITKKTRKNIVAKWVEKYK